jgi:hypothetical protein
MKHPFHVLQLLHRQIRSSLPSAEQFRVTPRTDLQWGRPQFRAPRLLTPEQRLKDLQFAADFRAKDWMRQP